MPICCKTAFVRFFQDIGPIQKSICFVLCFGAAIRDVDTQMSQDTAWSHTKQDARIAVWETDCDLAQDLWWHKKSKLNTEQKNYIRCECSFL